MGTLRLHLNILCVFICELLFWRSVQRCNWTQYIHNHFPVFISTSFSVFKGKSFPPTQNTKLHQLFRSLWFPIFGSTFFFLRSPFIGVQSFHTQQNCYNILFFASKFRAAQNTLSFNFKHSLALAQKKQFSGLLKMVKKKRLEIIFGVLPFVGHYYYRMHITYITSCLKDNINDISNIKSPCKYAPCEECGVHTVEQICEKPLDFQGISFIYNAIIALVSGDTHTPIEMPWTLCRVLNRAQNCALELKDATDLIKFKLISS